MNLTTNLDPFGGALDVVPAHQVQNYIQERVRALLMQKTKSGIKARKEDLAQLEREMAAVDGPPSKEQIEKHIRLKYGDDEPAGMAKARRYASANVPIRDDAALSDSIGF